MTKEMRIFKQIVSKIVDKGGRVFYVGGYVRDRIQGIDSKDIDVEIYGITVEETIGILKQFGKVDLVGKSFGILKIRGLDIDFAFPRKERQTGSKHTSFEVSVDPFMSTEEAASRRDFTMGAIMEDVMTGEIVDHFGGVADIESKVIRFVKEETFIEDSLRPLRAAQFAARFGMTASPELIELAQRMDYTQLSKERISAEVEKILLSPKPSIGFRMLKEMGVMAQIMPKFLETEHAEQSPIHHPEGSVFEHTMIVLDRAAKLKDQAESPLAFMLFALLHDVGKIEKTQYLESGRIRHLEHDTYGAEIVPEYFKEFSVRTRLIPYVKTMIEGHMKVKMPSARVYRRRVFISTYPTEELLLFVIADAKVGVAESEYSIEQLKEVARYEELKEAYRSASMGAPFKIVPIFTAKELIELGIPKTKLMGEALEFAKTEQMKDVRPEIIERHLRQIADRGRI